MAELCIHIALNGGVAAALGEWLLRYPGSAILGLLPLLGNDGEPGQLALEYAEKLIRRGQGDRVAEHGDIGPAYPG